MTALIVFILDQVSKYLILSYMELGQSAPVVSGVFHITFVRNPGGAFGLVPAGAAFFTVFSIIAVIAVIMYKFIARPASRLTNVALGLVMGGAAGNLVDRLTGGAVSDGLDFRVWPVFNFADSALVVGLFIIGLQAVLEKESDTS